MIFKEKIGFTQFVANLIQFQIDFIENNFDKLVDLADEYKVLSKNDKNELKSKIQVLAIADILYGCHQKLSGNISPQDINNCVAAVHKQYLTEYKNISEDIATKQVVSVKSFLEYLGTQEYDNEEANKMNAHDKSLFYLCSSFAAYFAGTNIKSKNYEGKQFAAFKLAKAITKGDLVANSLKRYSIVNS